MTDHLIRRRWSRFRQNKRALFGLIIFTTLLMIALFAPVIANDRPIYVSYKGMPYYPLSEFVPDSALGGTLPTEADYLDPYTQQQIKQHASAIWPLIQWGPDSIDYYSPTPFPAPPSARHILGTDDQGRDILTRLIYGFRLSLFFGLTLTVLSASFGILVGAVQGYFGGRTDLFIGRLLEIWGSLPQLFILIIVSSFITPGFWSLLLILLLFSWTALSGVVRAEFLKTRQQDYVLAAKVLGVSDWRIMSRHILPNALVATITYMPFILAGAIVSLSALDFLGLGMPAGTASLGDLIRQGKENLQAPWIGLSAFVSMTVILSVLIFMGEGVRDAFDPHSRGKV